MHLITLFLPVIIGLSSASNLIVSLGSSYAYGYGLKVAIGGYLQQTLTQSTGSAWSFNNYAIIGSTLKNITFYQAPKLEGLSPEIIYVLSGGNDLHYATCLSHPSKAECADPEDQSTWQTDFEDALDAVFTYVANPDEVNVYVATYPIAIGPDTDCNADNVECPISSTQEVDQLEQLYADQVDYTIAALKDWQSKNQQYNIFLIPMRTYSAGHDVGSVYPWVNGANVSVGAWHPNAYGASNISNYIYQAYMNGSSSSMADFSDKQKVLSSVKI